MVMDWKEHGVKIVHAGELDMNTPQTPGMSRAAAITHARTRANKLWAGKMVVQPDAKTGPHHHGELETVLYIVRGRVRMRWGDHLELSGEAEPGDFIYVPPYVPHQEINASPNEICEAVVVRNGQEPIVVNLDVETPEPASGHAFQYIVAAYQSSKLVDDFTVIQVDVERVASANSQNTVKTLPGFPSKYPQLSPASSLATVRAPLSSRRAANFECRR
jgi:uncharacterized RmlC-like cupin family protein